MTPGSCSTKTAIPHQLIRSVASERKALLKTVAVLLDQGIVEGVDVGRQHRRRRAVRVHRANDLYSTRHGAQNKKASLKSEAFNECVARIQVPKNSHSKSMTGIGTPSSQSKSPRPISISLNFNTRKENVNCTRSFPPITEPNGQYTDSEVARCFSCHRAKARFRRQSRRPKLSPMTGVWHRAPWLGGRARVTLLQQLDRVQIR